MHWEILIIPLIALGVWILGTLFKGGEDERFKKLGRRPGGTGSRTSPRRPVTELDRFLEEARQRREAEERRQAPPPSPPPPPPPPRTTISRPPLRERPAQPREAPLARPAPPIRKGEIPVAIPVAQAVAAPPPAAEAAPPPAAPVTTRDTRPSPVVQQVRSLLSKPRAAGAAFVLREIFDRPLCMRRRR